MKKLIVILASLVSLVSCHVDKNKKTPKHCATHKTDKIVTLPKKPKIVVLTSTGGNGHMATCAALQTLLPDCDLKLYHPIYDIFHNVINGEKTFYGKLLQNGWIRTINFTAEYPAQMYFKLHRTAFTKMVAGYLEKEKPDLLISVIPYINFPASQAAKQHKIPFMLITLDADLTLWLIDMERCKNPDFTITVQAKTPLIEKQLKRKHIPASCVKEIGNPKKGAFGCPLREDFFAPKNHAAIKKEWNIPAGKKVILLMRGGTGSDALVDYVKTLVTIPEKLHLLVCIGKNTALIEKLNSIKTTGPVSFTAIPFTKKIPDLMAISDLLITQPTPNVCNEAMFMKLPILIDMTGPCLFWEKATMDWIKLYGSGAIFKRMKHLKTMVPSFINKKQSQKQTPPSTCRFNTEIYKLVNAKLSLTT